MTLPSQDRVRNILLRNAPPDAFDALALQMTLIDLPMKFTLVEPDQPTNFICFLETGLASVVTITSDDHMAQVGHIGFEGATGLHTALHTEQSPSKTFIQGAGKGFQVPVIHLQTVLENSSEFRELIMRYLHVCSVQLAYTALSNARLSIYERLARWLLMSQDRLGNDLGLTHEFLSIMLGVRRASVTEHLHFLKGIGAIKSKRGNIRVLNRAKLEKIAGGSYGVAEREYERLIGTPPRIFDQEKQSR